MANEISISATLSASKNGATVTGSGSISISMSGDQFISNVQIVGTSDEEALVVGDVTPTGWFMLKNLDSTNYVVISLDDAGANIVATLLAGEFCVCKPGANLYAKANTAPVNLQVIATEL